VYCTVVASPSPSALYLVRRKHRQQRTSPPTSIRHHGQGIAPSLIISLADPASAPLSPINADSVLPTARDEVGAHVWARRHLATLAALIPPHAVVLERSAERLSGYAIEFTVVIGAAALVATGQDARLQQAERFYAGGVGLGGRHGQHLAKGQEQGHQDGHHGSEMKLGVHTGMPGAGG
jgi:hypothetical protein